MAQPIRILQVLGTLDRGGAEAMVMNLYRAIDRDKVQFDFVVHTAVPAAYDDEVIALGGKKYVAPRYSGKNHFAYKKWWERFFAEHSEYRIVHSHVRSTAAILLSIAKKHGCVTIAHSHSTSSGSGFSAFVKNMLQHPIRYVADYCIGCSQIAGEWLFGKKICVSDRYISMPNAIDVSSYGYDPNTAQILRRELDFREDDIVVGHVGRFSEPKNHLFLIDIFEQLYKHNDHYKLLLVGDGELQEQVRKKVQDRGLNNAVQFTGTRSDIPQLLMAMDVFLFPSKWEGLPVSVVEAQAAGLLCIISDVITHEVCITPLVQQISLHEPLSVWSSAVTKSIDTSHKDVRQEIIAAGYDISNTARKMADFYCGLF